MFYLIFIIQSTSHFRSNINQICYVTLSVLYDQNMLVRYIILYCCVLLLFFFFVNENVYFRIGRCRNSIPKTKTAVVQGQVLAQASHSVILNTAPGVQHSNLYRTITTFAKELQST